MIHEPQVAVSGREVPRKEAAEIARGTGDQDAGTGRHGHPRGSHSRDRWNRGCGRGGIAVACRIPYGVAVLFGLAYFGLFVTAFLLSSAP